jgi:hypothetical protein
MKEINISPSDLSYFWSDSKVGFYDKYVLEILRPRQTFPSVFNKIDLCMKDAFEKVKFAEIVKDAPEGYICHDEMNVRSKPVKLGDFKVTFKGKIDSLLVHEDQTHSVVDYKTTIFSEKLKDIYFLQLAAYAFCLENPAEGEPKTIRSLGLLVYSPQKFQFKQNKTGDQGALIGELKWLEVPFDKEKFKKFMSTDLKKILNSDRENILLNPSYLDLSWQKYINCFYLEEE